MNIAMSISVLILMGLAATYFFPAVRLAFVPLNVMDHRVITRARDVFLQQEIFNTIERTGILIYISELEKRVQVLGDKGISSVIVQDDWNNVLGLVTDGIKQGNPAKGLVLAIGECKKLLLENGFIVRVDDTNELSDEMIIEDQLPGAIVKGFNYIVTQLEKNHSTFNNLLSGSNKEEYLWKPQPDKWCLLEVICHLCDEEKEDFRTRVKTTLESPEKLPPPIDPVSWVNERKYIQQDFETKIEEFSTERLESVRWLNSLENPNWNNSYKHELLGDLSAHLFLSNWLAHDYMHIRQILRIKFQYLQSLSGESLDYAGVW